MLFKHSILAVATLAALASCKADKVGENNIQEDAGLQPTLEIPVLEVVPQTTPNASVAIRGTSGGQRVVVQGAADGTSVVAILPGGSFCTEVGLADGEETALTVYAIGSGLISEPSSVVVTKDATAPQPANPTCSGGSPDSCETREEICDNEEDENCDGWIDICDRECSGCIGDAFEPNDFAVNVPLIAAGTYELQICPCRDDWFAFEREAGQRVRLTVDFEHATVPINLRLYQATQTGEQGALVAFSFSISDQESLDELIETDGLYYLRIYATGTNPTESGAYTLTIQ
jgi:hypothetical protein